MVIQCITGSVGSRVGYSRVSWILEKEGFKVVTSKHIGADQQQCSVKRYRRNAKAL